MKRWHSVCVRFIAYNNTAFCKRNSNNPRAKLSHNRQLAFNVIWIFWSQSCAT